MSDELELDLKAFFGWIQSNEVTNTIIKLSNIHWEFWDTQTYQSTKYKKHSKRSADSGFASDVTIAHSGHGNNSKVNTFPVREFLWIVEAIERIARCLNLKGIEFKNVISDMN